MKKIETELFENNKLIAEFMGVDYVDIDTYLENNKELQYHTSWDWLMPVVEKIEDIECKETSTDLVGYHLYDIEIRQNVTTIHGTNIEETVGDKLFNTYQTVVEFIKWYNKQDRFICGVCGDHVNEYTHNKDKDVDECNNCK